MQLSLSRHVKLTGGKCITLLISSRIASCRIGLPSSAKSLKFYTVCRHEFVGRVAPPIYNYTPYFEGGRYRAYIHNVLYPPEELHSPHVVELDGLHGLSPDRTPKQNEIP